MTKVWSVSRCTWLEAFSFFNTCQTFPLCFTDELILRLQKDFTQGKLQMIYCLQGMRWRGVMQAEEGGKGRVELSQQQQKSLNSNHWLTRNPFYRSNSEPAFLLPNTVLWVCVSIPLLYLLNSLPFKLHPLIWVESPHLRPILSKLFWWLPSSLTMRLDVEL